MHTIFYMLREFSYSKCKNTKTNTLIQQGNWLINPVMKWGVNSAPLKLTFVSNTWAIIED
jgi:hypothetical protein